MKDDRFDVFISLMQFNVRTFPPVRKRRARVTREEFKEAQDLVIWWGEQAIRKSLPRKVTSIIRKRFNYRAFGPLIRNGADLFWFMHRLLHDIVECVEAAAGRRKWDEAKRCGNWCGAGFGGH